MAIKNIRVDEKVHKQIVKKANANDRGIGDQVAYWAKNECSHPESEREYVTAELPMPEQDALVEDQGRRLLVGFYCLQCKRYVFKKLLTPSVS